METINLNNERVVLQEAVDTENYRVAVVLSEEVEVVRYNRSDGMYYLTLGHDEAEVDLSRKDILGVFINHNTNALPTGKFEDVRLEDRKLKAFAKFDKNDEESLKIFNKLADGFLQSFSVGINVYEKVLEREVDGTKYYRATKWEIHEASVVGVPAIAGAKVGLKQDEDLGVNPASVEASAKIENKPKGDDSMEYTKESFEALEASHAEALQNETNRALDILGLNGDMTIKINGIKEGLSAGDVAIELNKNVETKINTEKTDFEKAAEDVQDLATEDTPEAGEELSAEEKAIKADDEAYYKTKRGEA